MSTGRTTILGNQKQGATSKELRPLDELNLILADLQVIRQYLHNFHWNVDGERFLELHGFFEQQYDQLHEHVDNLAERLKLLGVYPLGTMGRVLKHARISEPEMPMEPREMLSRFILDLRGVNERIRLVISEAGEQNDHGTADLLADILRDQEMTTWKLAMMLK